MGAIDNFLRFLKDDYKVGVEAESTKPVVYIDPNQIDLWALELAIKRKDTDAAAEQIARQLDDQSPGLSAKLSQKELLGLLQLSLEKGPFADRSNIEKHGVCIVNQPMGKKFDRDQLYNTFGFTGIFDLNQMKPLPGSAAVWRELIGRHEGEHCNQENITHDDPEVHLKVLKGEVGSDIAALKDLRAQGLDDVAQAWMDIRVLAASKGDDLHATSIFLIDLDPKEITQEHLAAARQFTEEMSKGVAAELGMSFMEAKALRGEDPQKYAKAVDAALTTGKIPVPREMSGIDLTNRVAKEMGLSPEEFKKLGSDRAADIAAAHAKLKDEGALLVPGNSNPYIKDYARQYVGAVGRAFVADTTPPPKPPAPPKEEPVVTEPSAEEVAAEEDKEMKRLAAIEYSAIMKAAVGAELGLTEEEVTLLNEEDPDKYIETVETLVKEGKITSEMVRPATFDEADALVAKSLGVSVEDMNTRTPPGSFVYSQAYDRLQNEGALQIKYQNPHLLPAIEAHVQQYNENKAVAPAEPADPETEPKSDKVAGTYDYLREAALPDTGKGVPKINLAGGDRAEMKIGCLTACEYFAMQADPVLASQQLAQASTLEADLSVEQRTAANRQAAGPTA